MNATSGNSGGRGGGGGGDTIATVASHQHQHHPLSSAPLPSALSVKHGTQSAMDYKNAGNKYFSVHRYEEAIAYYSRAIMQNPTIPALFSNRALCFLKTQQWPKAVQDCRRAIELDPNSIKGNLFMGQALLEQALYEDALKYLLKAYDLAKKQNLNFGDDIASLIRLIKMKLWSQIEDKRELKETQLRMYLNNLIQQDKQRRLNELIVQQDVATSSSDTSHLDLLRNKQTEISQQCDEYAEQLNKIFDDIENRRKQRDVPDFLCGKISFEIMKDPVITPYGITYDRRDIEEHLQRVGHFDPITRQPLKSDQLIPNLAIKEVVDAYLNENEWALFY